MAICPNVTHPDWKALVSKHGENGAWKRYVENGNKIPAIDGKSKSTRAKIYVDKISSSLQDLFSPKSTLDSLEKHPKTAAKMIDELSSLYPDIRIFKDRIIDENGNYLNIPSDKEGRHYRSAFLSAVAWTNSSTFETPPHEYAHEYIDMYREHPLVKDAIEKYGEERLVTLIARKYAGQKMSNSFQKFINAFWDLIKTTFGSPSVVDILTDSFAKNEKLGNPLGRTTPVHNFNSENGPMLGKNNALNYNEDVLNKREDNSFLSPSAVKEYIESTFVKGKVIGSKEMSNEINIQEVKPTSKYVSFRESFSSPLSKIIIKLKESKKLTDISNKIESYVKPKTDTLTQDQALKKVYDIQKEGKLFKLTDGGRFYSGKGLLLERQSNFIERLLGTKTNLNQALKRGASVGNLVDIIGRGVFDDDIKTLDYYKRKSNEMNEENEYTTQMTQKEFENLVGLFKSLKAEMKAKGMRFVANDVFVYRKYTQEELQDEKVKELGVTGVGGTLDLVAVDPKGNVHIVDFKNIKYTKDKERFLTPRIFDGGVYDKGLEPSMVDKWANQQSTYKLLMEANGVPVASTNILPLSTTYETETDDNSINLEAYNSWWFGIKQKAKKVHQTDSSTRTKTEYAGVDDSKITRIERVGYSSEETKINLIKKLRGDDIELESHVQEVYEDIIDVIIATAHKNTISKSYLSPDGKKRVDESVIKPIFLDEVEGQNKIRKKNRESKNRFTRYIAKKLDYILTWVTNPQLWAKFLSGGNFTMTSQVLNIELLAARIPAAEYAQTFWGKIESIASVYQNSSVYYNEKATIDELETETFQIDSELNEGIDLKEIKLTKSELLMVYLMNRQKKGRENLTLGIHIEHINGRDFPLSTKFRFTEEQIGKITLDISQDADAQKVVSNIDDAIKYTYGKMNPVFKALEGYDMEDIPFYFPVFHGGEKEGGIRKTKNIIANHRNLRGRIGGGAIRLVDPFKVLNAMERANAQYIGYAIPIHNAQKMINDIKSKFFTEKKGDILSGKNGYILELQGTIDMIQDGSLLFTSQGQQGINKIFNKLLGNFGVAHLAKNFGVVLKQQASLETATAVIPRQFINASGGSIAGVSFINPYKLLKQLSISSPTKGETWMPVEWEKIKNDPDYIYLIENYPLMKLRFEGMVSRESGEVVMGKSTADDIITIPGTNIKITKSRAMMGITIMDTLTILRLYKATQLWTAHRRQTEPKFAALSDAQIKVHEVNVLQDAIDKTQPTFDVINRTGFARNPDPIAKGFTMFSSATQKMYGRLIDSLIDANMNPSPENIKAMWWRVYHTSVTMSVMLATINTIWYGIGHGWDDDDWEELPGRYFRESVKTTFGVPVVNKGLGVYFSHMDSNPWYQTVQDPASHMVQKSGEALANLTKGNMLQASRGMIEVFFNAKGLPMVPVNKAITYGKAIVEK